MKKEKLNEYLFFVYSRFPYKVKAKNLNEAILRYGKSIGIKDDIFIAWIYDISIDGFRCQFATKTLIFDSDGDILEFEEFNDNELRDKIRNFFNGYTKDISDDFFRFCKNANYEFNEDELFYIWCNVEKGWGFDGVRLLEKEDDIEFDTHTLVIDLSDVEELNL